MRFSITEKKEETFLHINTGRQPELDFVKALAIIFMIFGHVFEMLNPRVGDTGTPGLIYTLSVNSSARLFSSPAFMFCMGVGMIFSRHREAKDFWKRGLRLFLLAYVLSCTLNGSYWCFYYLCGMNQYHSAEAASFLQNMFCVDILQFAGITFLITGFFRYLRFNNLTIAIIALLSLLLGSYLTGKLTSGVWWFDAMTGLFFWVNTTTCFPFSLWFIYVAAGMLFGTILIRTKEKRKLYGRMAAAGVTGLLGYGIYALCIGHFDPMFFDFDSFFRQNPIRVWLTLSAISVWIPLCNLCYSHFPSGGLLAKTISRWSKNLTIIFFSQWILLAVMYRGIYMLWIGWLLGPRTIHWPELLITSILLIALSDGLAAFFIHHQKRNNTTPLS